MDKDTPNTQAVNGQYDPVEESKTFRKDLDAILQRYKSATRSNRERSLAITNLQQAIMWTGMDLKALREEGYGSDPEPYPASYDPSSAVIEPTAGGIGL